MIAMGIKMNFRSAWLFALLFAFPAFADLSQEAGQPPRTSRDAPIIFPLDKPQGASIAIGQFSMAQPATGGASGQANIAIGYQAMFGAMTSAAQNDICIGYQACKITSGANNIAIGVGASKYTTGSRDITIGWVAGGPATGDYIHLDPEGTVTPFAGQQNVVLGTHTAYSQNGGTVIGDDCFFNDIASGTGFNICIGENVARTNIGSSATVPNQVIMIGTGSALDGATNATVTALGIGSGKVGQFDTSAGYLALASQTANGSKNTVFGKSGLNALTTGTNAAAFGYSAGSSITTGSNNTVLGYSVASSTLTTGGSNILIGTSSTVTTPAASTSNMINIGGLLFFNNTSTAVPVLSSCGVSPSVDANANAKSGTVTVGSGTVASCTVTFASAYSSWNHCRVTSQTGGLAGFGYSYSASAITITATSLTSKVFDYDCDGY